MTSVLENLSGSLQQELSLHAPSEVLVWDDREWRLYEDKDTAALLNDHGFLNVGVGAVDSATDEAISLQKLSETDLGLGFQGKKKQVVTSDVSGLSLRETELSLFHWNGFASKIDLTTNALVNQYMAGGAIGEFGQMIYDAFQNGVEWLNSLIEMIRRTPVLGLIANTAMRVITMMTPNFWAEMVGTGGGFVIPEVIIWLICLLIGALASASGAGAAPAVAALAASTAAKIRRLIKGSGNAFRAITRFLDLLQPIIAKIGPLGRKLRDSIREIARGVVDKTQRLFRRTRYWREKLDDLARQGHGPQRHEGDVKDKQLFDRVYRGIDPMTGNLHRRDRRGRITGVGPHSTKFNTPADYVRTYEKVLETPEYRAFISGASDNVAVELPLSSVFGSNFLSRLKGYSRVSGRTGNSPTIAPTVFSQNSKVLAVFRRDAQVQPFLLTMYPQP